MTSSLSTVPYNQEQCEAYLRLIRVMPESYRAEGYRNCVLARVWSEINNHFFNNLREEETPRLPRMQRLIPEPNLRPSRLVTFLKRWLVLGNSAIYERALNEIWVDKVTHAHYWRTFIVGMVSEWKMYAV